MRSRRAERVVAERERRAPQGVCWGKWVGEDWSSGAGEAPVPQGGEGEWVLAGEWRNGVLKGMAGVNQKKGKLGMRGGIRLGASGGSISPDGSKATCPLLWEGSVCHGLAVMVFRVFLALAFLWIFAFF